METLILHPTATSQWHSLVHDACNKSNTVLSHDLESYMIFMLMRFINSPELLHKIMALELLTCYQQPALQRQQSLQAVGDACLLFAGLFPGIARRRRVRISYYIKLGQTAYSILAEQSAAKYTALFSQLSLKFVELMDTLHSMRETNNLHQSLDLLQAEEIWHDTRSKQALNTLQKFTVSPFICHVYNSQQSVNLKH